MKLFFRAKEFSLSFRVLVDWEQGALLRVDAGRFAALNLPGSQTAVICFTNVESERACEVRYSSFSALPALFDEPALTTAQKRTWKELFYTSCGAGTIAFEAPAAQVAVTNGPTDGATS